MNRKPPLKKVYQALYHAWGPQHWWPAQSRFEMMVGAILTQNTAWKNVELAIRNLKKAGVLTVESIAALPREQLAALIRPAGYFNIKAKRIQHFTRWLMDKYNGNINRMFTTETEELRRQLLEVHGIGKETADSILLYAGHRPVFVVDAYTRRFMLRHRWLSEKNTYDEVADIFSGPFKGASAHRQSALFNEYHALIVRLAKEHCRAKPDCASCPLKRWLP